MQNQLSTYKIHSSKFLFRFLQQLLSRLNVVIDRIFVIQFDFIITLGCILKRKAKTLNNKLHLIFGKGQVIFSL